MGRNIIMKYIFSSNTRWAVKLQNCKKYHNSSLYYSCPLFKVYSYKTNLKVFRIAWKNSMSSYRQALKAARTEHIHKLIDNNQNNPRILFSTVARLKNNQTAPDLNISS